MILSLVARALVSVLIGCQHRWLRISSVGRTLRVLQTGKKGVAHIGQVRVVHRDGGGYRLTQVMAT